RCNHLLETVPKEAVLDRLEPLTRLYFDEFRICPNCQQIYWKGSHYEGMQEIVEKLREDSS
ncbi:MAG TPA: Mut7-C RNAse domain-containing protein, partial [Anaerolineales bacterium]